MGGAETDLRGVNGLDAAGISQYALVQSKHLTASCCPYITIPKVFMKNKWHD